MLDVHTIARRRFRRLYYYGLGLLILLTVGSFIVPGYFGIRSELTTKIDQLSESIIEQKRALIRTIVEEKIGDIERIRNRLEANEPPLPPDELDRRFRAEVRELIHTTELPDDGYIWINEIVDYAGGDDYAIRFAHPNLKDTEGDYLSTNTPDIAGNFPYLEELEGVRRSGEIYFDYYFKEMASDEISHKLSFAKLYPPNDWVVATGVYLNDVDRLIAEETAGMIASANRTLRNGIIAVFLGISVLVAMTIYFETRISLLIDSYIDTEHAISAQLLEEKSKLEESNKQKDRLFSIVAHDLRNPIHALSSGIGLLNDSAEEHLDDFGRSVVDELNRSAKGVSKLLDQLLQWSRSQQGAIPFNPTDVNVGAAVATACEGLSAMARQKEINLQQNVDREVTVYADQQMLVAIIRNLVGNAVKYTPRGGSVTIFSRVVDNAVEISVADTGVGIAEEGLKKLFAVEYGYHTDGTEGELGSGLGLDLCNEFVQRHGGSLCVESTVGEGSTFRVTLPTDNHHSVL